MLNWEKLTRLTVIDHRANGKGIVFEQYNVKLDCLIQDDERTLKVIVLDSEESDG